MSQAMMEPEVDELELAPDRRRDRDDRVNWVKSIPFITLQFTPLLLLLTGISRVAVGLLLVTYFGRMFVITAGYHRYFSHKAYRLNRFWQFVFAFAGTSCAQKGPLWWAGHHRNHHKFSDTERDLHSPRDGFWWSHIGWIMSSKYGETRYDQIRRFREVPRARAGSTSTIGLHRGRSVSRASSIGGWSGLVLGFFTSTRAALALDLSR